jgi:UDP-glucose 4-epimerase
LRSARFFSQTRAWSVLASSTMRALVTGGAGYIGSHMALVLLRAGHQVVVVDDLSSGHRDAVPAGATFVEASVADRIRMGEVLRRHGVEAILHFAARIQVGESVRDPRLYYQGNVAASIALLESALDAQVERFVLSSTAAVYGDPVRVPIDEDHPTTPINPYGDTKLAIERMLYDTPDGTCVRDYIHVLDLCEAHLVALEHLASGSQVGALNLGTGQGHSVEQVIDTVQRVSGREVRVVRGPRRPGDPPRLIASPEGAARILKWRAKRPSLDEIVGDAWQVRSHRVPPRRA